MGEDTTMGDAQEFFGIGIKRIVMIGATIGLAPVLVGPLAERTGMSPLIVLVALAAGAVLAAGGTIKDAGQAALAGVAINAISGIAGNAVSGSGGLLSGGSGSGTGSGSGSARFF